MRHQTKSAISLNRGDVFALDRKLVVLVESSDHVSSAPPTETFKGLPASECCEPKIGYLLDDEEMGMWVSEVTHVVLYKRRRFTIRGHFNLDILSVV